MYVFYIIALIPVIVGLGFYLFSPKFTWLEWLISAGASFLLAGIFQLISYYGLTADYETWSGQIAQARHYAAWKEYYEYEVDRTEYYTTTEYSTDSKGRSHSHQVQHSRQVFDHWEPTTRWHSDDYHWWSTIQTDYGISVDQFNYISKKFGDLHAVAGDRTTMEHASRMIGGDPNDYISDNHTGWIQPVTKQVEFENRIKASGNTVYNFVKPSIDQQKTLFQYPVNDNPYQSNRVLGTARNTISDLAWDQLNARLGAAKKVNLIIIGFSSPDSMLAQQEESLYLRGKKNDLVLCYGDGWTRVFGWTEHAEVMRNLEDILMSNKIDESILPKIEAEVRANYILKPWKKFDYLAIEPPAIDYLWYFLVLIVVEGGIFTWAMMNEMDKDESDGDLSEGLDNWVAKMLGGKPTPKKQKLTKHWPNDYNY